MFQNMFCNMKGKRREKEANVGKSMETLKGEVGTSKEQLGTKNI